MSYISIFLSSDGQKAQLLKEMSGLNLTKYVGELSSALLEAKLKMSDVTAAVEFCSVVHQKVKLFSIPATGSYFVLGAKFYVLPLLVR